MKHFYCILLCIFALLSCTKESYITLNSGQHSYEIPADGGTISISFSSSEAWSVSSNESWVTISPLQGEAGNSTIKITATANPDIESSRSTDIQIKISDKYENLSVSQGESIGYLIAEKEFEISKDGGILRIPVKANTTDYSCTVDKACENWISIIKTKSLASYSIQLEISKNTHGEEREGTIIVSHKNHEESIKIKQSEGDELIVSTKSFEVGSNGGEIKVPVSTNKALTTDILSGEGWITAKSIQTKSMEEYYIVFSIKPNTTYDDRIGQVKVLSGANIDSSFLPDGNESIITITQSQLDELIVTTTSYEIGSNGGTISIPVKSSTDYSYEVLGNNPWLSASLADTKSLGTSYINVSIEKNTSYDDRVGQIKFTGAGKESIVTITQKQCDELVIGQTNYEISSSGGEIDVKVSSNVEYSAQVIGDAAKWISVKSVLTKSLEQTAVVLEIKKNEDYDARVGQVKFTGAGKESTVTITQEQYDELIIEKTQYEVNSCGEEITIELETNTDYSYFIADDAKTWIIPKIETKSSLCSESLTFIVENNDTGVDRTGIINIHINGKTISITVLQNGIIEIHNTVKGGLLDALSGFDLEKIVSLKVTGILNDIDFLAFSTQLSNLKNLDISEVNITSLPSKAFYHTKSLEKVLLPRTLSIIGKSAFEGSNIKSMIIPANVTEIEQRAFANCRKLVSVTFDENSSLTKICGGDSDSRLAGAFYNCLLKEIEIPASVNQIESGAFAYCTALNKVVFEKGIALDRISGPETNTLDSDGVFYYCTSLESIEIPASVEIIGKRAFADSGLRTITFESGSKLKRICGGSTTGAYYGAFYSSRIKSIIIPKSVEIIEDAAFLNSSLEEVTFEKGSALKQIGGGYRYGVGHGAFQGTSIKSIVIPAGVTEIKPATFENCKELERVSFEQGSHLRIIRGLEGNSALDYSPHGAFMDCSNLTSIDIPSSVVGIDYAAFSDCTNLKNITFGENSSLKFIAGGSHRYNFGITYYGAFNNCTSLVSITIPANVESIGEVAFKGCSNLETVVFAPSAKISAIDHGAFEEATKLWHVDMSEAKNIGLIDDFAFAGCPILIFKIGASTPPRCGTNTFDSISDHSVLKVPTASVDSYKSSRVWSKFTNISGIDD